tara:strand:- start:560 stop:1162 length:603 start_codon:yes stop_codon:yes gene_type:complete
MYQVKSKFLFPSQIVSGEIQDFDKIQQPLIDWIYKYKNNHQESARLSNVGGWQSESKEIFNDEGFKPFEKTIIDCIFELCFEYELIHPLQLIQMWINVNQPNTYNISHRHPGNTLSGVLWIKQTASMGKFVFDNMDVGYRDAMLLINTNKEHLDKHNMINEFTPEYEDGTMMLFPSGLSHRVEINKSKEDRISLSFNLFS